MDDLWRWGCRFVPPRAVEEAMVAALGPQREWRVTASASRILIEVGSGAAEAATATVATLLNEVGVVLPVQVAGPPIQDGPKRRRVRWSDDR